MKYVLSITLFLFSIINAQAESIEKQTLSFGIVPQQTKKELLKKWNPILKYLSDKSNLKLQIESARSIPEFEKNVSIGKYDFAYMNPYHYIVFSKKPGYNAILREKNKQIKGIIVTRKDSPFNTLKDLENLEISFPAPAAFAASIIPRAILKKNGIKIQPVYVNSHSSVYQSVASDRYKAGGGIIRTLSISKNNIKTRLKVFWESKGYSPHAIATHPSVSKESRKALSLAAINMHKDPKGKLLLKENAFNAFIAAKDSDWEDIRALKISVKLAKGTD